MIAAPIFFYSLLFLFIFPCEIPCQKYPKRENGVQGVASSNLVIPTRKFNYLSRLQTEKNGISGPLESHFLLFKGS